MKYILDRHANGYVPGGVKKICRKIVRRIDEAQGR